MVDVIKLILEDRYDLNEHWDVDQYVDWVKDNHKYGERPIVTLDRVGEEIGPLVVLYGADGLAKIYFLKLVWTSIMIIKLN